MIRNRDVVTKILVAAVCLSGILTPTMAFSSPGRTPALCGVKETLVEPASSKDMELNDQTTSSPCLSRSTFLESATAHAILFICSLTNPLQLKDVSARQTVAENTWADIDGALGITWGGKYRCDPSSLDCAADGKTAASAKNPNTQSSTNSSEVISPPELATTSSIDRRYLATVRIDGKVVGKMELGTWSKLAPASCDAFDGLVKGTILVEGRKVAYGDVNVAYIDGGERYLEAQPISVISSSGTRIRNEPLTLPPNSDRVDGVPHDSGGILSVKGGGGGNGGFLLTTAAKRRPRLDRDFVPIGQVTTPEAMETVAKLGKLPVNKYKGTPLRKLTISFEPL